MRNLGGRPRGDIRLALAKAAKEAQGGATCVELARAACVGYRAARQTVANIVRAGELKPIGKRVVPDVPRGLLAFVPACNTDDAADAVRQLGNVLAAWGR